MYLQSPSILWLYSLTWLLVGVRGYQGRSCVIIQQVSLAYSSGGIRVPSIASPSDQVPFKYPLTSYLLFSHWPKQVTWASPESVFGKTDQRHGKKK